LEISVIDISDIVYVPLFTHGGLVSIILFHTFATSI